MTLSLPISNPAQYERTAGSDTWFHVLGLRGQFWGEATIRGIMTERPFKSESRLVDATIPFVPPRVGGN
ncbi:hypothetical protein JTE90_010757, partial [Oedothorax gibbosus]